MKSIGVLSILAITLLLGTMSCNKEAKKNIEGTWTMTEFLVDGQIFFQPSTNNSIVWTFADGEVSGVTTYMDGPNVITETDGPTKYKIKDGGETLELDGDERTITELTATTLVLTWESGGEIAKTTFTK